MNFDPEVQKKFFNKLTNNNVTLERIKDNKYSITKLNELLNRIESHTLENHIMQELSNNNLQNIIIKIKIADSISGDPIKCGESKHIISTLSGITGENINFNNSTLIDDSKHISLYIIFYDKSISTKKDYAHLSIHLTQMDFTNGTVGPIHLVKGYSRGPGKKSIPINYNNNNIKYYNNKPINTLVIKQLLISNPEFKITLNILSEYLSDKSNYSLLYNLSGIKTNHKCYKKIYKYSNKKDYILREPRRLIPKSRQSTKRKYINRSRKTLKKTINKTSNE